MVPIAKPFVLRPCTGRDLRLPPFLTRALTTIYPFFLFQPRDLARDGFVGLSTLTIAGSFRQRRNRLFISSSYLSDLVERTFCLCL